jgi:hypothetical protein
LQKDKLLIPHVQNLRLTPSAAKWVAEIGAPLRAQVRIGKVVTLGVTAASGRSPGGRADFFGGAWGRGGKNPQGGARIMWSIHFWTTGSALMCLTTWMMVQPIIYRSTNLSAELAQERARLVEVMQKSLVLLQDPSPDTFLGRQRHEPVQLPYERE